MLLKYGRLGERPLPALRYMTVAGGELRHDLAEEIARRIKPASFHVMYGQSEATARLASLPPQQLHVRRGSIGRPISGVELAVMDELNCELSSNAVGMLCARGKNVMLGYGVTPPQRPTRSVPPMDGCEPVIWPIRTKMDLFSPAWPGELAGQGPRAPRTPGRDRRVD